MISIILVIDFPDAFVLEEIRLQDQWVTDAHWKLMDLNGVCREWSVCCFLEFKSFQSRIMWLTFCCSLFSICKQEINGIWNYLVSRHEPQCILLLNCIYQAPKYLQPDLSLTFSGNIDLWYIKMHRCKGLTSAELCVGWLVLISLCMLSWKRQKD